MPRNSVGNYSPPAGTVPLPNTLGDATKVASYLADLGAEITTSVATDGRTPMTGPLTLSGNATAALHAVALRQIQTGGAVQPGGLSTGGPAWDATGLLTANSIASLSSVDAYSATNDVRIRMTSTYGGNTGHIEAGNISISSRKNLALNAFGGSVCVGTGTPVAGSTLTISGTATATTFSIDNNFYYNISSGNPFINFDATDYMIFERTNNEFYFAIGNSIRGTINSTGFKGNGSQITGIDFGAGVAAIPLNGVGTPIVRLSGNYVVGGIYSNSGATPLPAGSWRCESTDGISYSGGITVNAALLKRVS